MYRYKMLGDADDDLAGDQRPKACMTSPCRSRQSMFREGREDPSRRRSRSAPGRAVAEEPWRPLGRGPQQLQLAQAVPHCHGGPVQPPAASRDPQQTWHRSVLHSGWMLRRARPPAGPIRSRRHAAAVRGRVMNSTAPTKRQRASTTGRVRHGSGRRRNAKRSRSSTATDITRMISRSMARR